MINDMLYQLEPYEPPLFAVPKRCSTIIGGKEQCKGIATWVLHLPSCDIYFCAICEQNSNVRAFFRREVQG